MAKAKSGTLDPGIVTEVTVTVDPFGGNRGVGITNRTGTGEIWVRIDGEDPIVEGDDCYIVIAVRELETPTGASSITVKLLSNDAISYTVEGSG